MIGTLSDDPVFVGFAELSTKHQPKNPVNELPLDKCEDIVGRELVVCLHVKLGKLFIDLQEKLVSDEQGDQTTTDLWEVCHVVCR